MPVTDEMRASLIKEVEGGAGAADDGGQQEQEVAQPEEAATETQETEGEGQEQTEADPTDQPAEVTNGAGVKFVKMTSGEYVPKKVYLATVKQLADQRKALKEKLQAWESKKDHYQRWDTNGDKYEQAMKFNMAMAEAAKKNPWYNMIAEAAWNGQDPDMNELAKAMGIEVAQPAMDDPQAPVLKKVSQLEEKLAQRERAERDAREQSQFKAKFETELKQASEKFKDHWNDEVKNAAIDLAMSTPADSPTPPSLFNAAERIVKMLKAHEAAVVKKMRPNEPKRQQAGVEKGGGASGQVKKPDPAYRSKEWTQRFVDELGAAGA